MTEKVSHHCYVPEFQPCPDCSTCEQHQHRHPMLTVRRRFYRVMQDGTRLELTEEEYQNRLIPGVEIK